MSGTEDDDYTVKLDTNIEVETIVRNRFEEFEDLCNNDPFSNLFAVSSDEEQIETSGESSQASLEYKEMDNVASAGSDGSENYASAVSDISAESTDSMAADSPPVQKAIPEQPSSSKEDTVFFEPRFKYMNSKELIVFCIDMSSDMENVPYVITDEYDERDRKYSYSKNENCFMRQTFKAPASKTVKQTKHSPLSMVKRAIGMFVHNKHFLDKKHEYSLMVLYDTATWVCEFTNNPNQLIDGLEDLTETVKCTSCDLSSIVSLLTEKYPFLLSSEFQSPEMQRLFRIILIYGRSNCMIEFSDPSARDVFMDYPSIFLDIVYVHEPPSEDNKCVEIYEALCNLDDRDKSYIFETTRNITNLHNAMGRLLSHPLQRVPQKNVNYKLQDIMPQEEGN